MILQREAQSILGSLNVSRAHALRAGKVLIRDLGLKRRYPEEGTEQGHLLNIRGTDSHMEGRLFCNGHDQGRVGCAEFESLGTINTDPILI